MRVPRMSSSRGKLLRYDPHNECLKYTTSAYSAGKKKIICITMLFQLPEFAIFWNQTLLFHQPPPNRCGFVAWTVTFRYQGAANKFWQADGSVCFKRGICWMLKPPPRAFFKELHSLHLTILLIFRKQQSDTHAQFTQRLARCATVKKMAEF